MRTLKIVTIAMAIMIVAGVVVLGVTIMRRLSGPPGGMVSAAVVLDEPAGTRIVGFASLPDRLVIQLQGGGPDRILFVDPRSGQALGRLVLAR
jgi:hypothetical protein